MEMNKIELTPEQKGVLASLSEETGEPVDTLIDKALTALQAHMRVRRMHETANGSKNTQGSGFLPRPSHAQLSMRGSGRITRE